MPDQKAPRFARVNLETALSIQVKRVYDVPRNDDGVRILVDRLWPRGLSKETAAIAQWIRECAPSDELRKWFAHDNAKWHEFKVAFGDP
jgi:uncharacterized protein YeaO (DUF488 family)